MIAQVEHAVGDDARLPGSDVGAGPGQGSPYTAPAGWVLAEAGPATGGRKSTCFGYLDRRDDGYAWEAPRPPRGA